MEPWIWGLVVIAGLGVAVIGYGVLSDRVLDADRRRAAVAPPDRRIPGLADDAPAPTYLTPTQIRESAGATARSDAGRPEFDHPGVDHPAADHPGAATSDASEEDPGAAGPSAGKPGTGEPSTGQPTAEEPAAVRAAVDSTRDDHRFPIGWTDPDFVTEPGPGWAVLYDPAVLLCTDPVTDLRELLPLLQATRGVDRPLLVGAPDFDPVVSSTLALNARQHPRSLLLVRMPTAAMDAIAALTGSEPVPGAVLRADAVRSEQLGHCALWVSGSDRTWIPEHGVSIEQ